MRAYLPPQLERGERAWGLGVNLYAVRSARNWGMGDFTDLRTLVEAAVRLGADLVGINPLHALHWIDLEAASPYAPNSRFFLNPFYIDVEAVPEFADPAVRRLVENPTFQGALQAARTSPSVRYPLVRTCKRRALEALNAAFQRGTSVERQHAYERFLTRESSRLQWFARHEALSESFAREEGRARGWLSWPEEFRNPESGAVERFALEAHRRVSFFLYLQFVADEQLAAAAHAARDLSIGLYRDLAVGVDLNSADVWSEQRRYVFDYTVGAPPDPIGPLGQNWNLAPLDPGSLEREGGAIFAALLRSNMAHAGALRIDHVMSMQRLFWIPRGGRPTDGAYVAYPFETMRSVAAAESVRARCTIVGEDLGTVPDGFRECMEADGILSYRPLLFERDWDGSFCSPERYPSNALATATTHDLPTLLGWALGRDIDVRLRAGLMEKDAAQAAAAARRIDASHLLEALRAAGELDAESVTRLQDALDERRSDAGAYASLVAAAYCFLARSPARIVQVQFDDVSGELDQVNVPGTLTEYPNWRRRSGLAVDALTQDERLTGLAARLNQIVRGGRGA
jgi:(1->4)-alpha-D-glucan 1-alpha-D-glucosylmutase